ncbi:MAG: sigma-54-dependent Fis family transcriptional regulator, partial [Calditrichaeota bacterium]
NTIERCVTLAEPTERLITPEALPAELRATATPTRSTPSAPQSLSQAVEALERSLVADALRRFQGNRSKAAASLGLSRRGLLNKIERYGLKG